MSHDTHDTACIAGRESLHVATSTDEGMTVAVELILIACM